MTDEFPGWDPPTLYDYPPPEFVEHILSLQPAPRSKVTGKPLWEKGIKLHGGQYGVLTEPFRFQMGSGGIRGGKSFSGGAKVDVDFSWRVGERGITDDLWWIIGPDYTQTTEEMLTLHRLLEGANVPHRFRATPGQQWEITFPGIDAMIQTKSGRDEATIAGKPVRGIVLCEADQTSQAVLDACQERVLETRGWVYMSGTFERAGTFFRKKAREWKRGTPGAFGVNYPLPTWENLVVFPGGRTDPEILLYESMVTPDKFWERYGGEARQPTGLKMRYANLEYHVKHRYPALKTSFDPELPVFLAIDPGSNHAYAVLAIQMFGNLAYVIDAVYRWGRTSQQLIDETANRPWAYKVDTAVMDIASKQRNANGEPVEEQWAAGWLARTGTTLNIYMNFVPLDQGYDLHLRALLNCWPEEHAKREFDPDNVQVRVTDPKGPRIMWDPEAARCVFGGLVDGRLYEGEYMLHAIPTRKDGTIPHDTVIDEDNDAIKAMNYFAYWAWRVTGETRITPQMYEPIPFEMVVE